MVYLSRIYTKFGDGGETALGDGARVAKDNPRVAAYGEVDELNATLGVMLASLEAEEGMDELCLLVQGIQNDLFDVGADLCVPESSESSSRSALRIIEPQVTMLEEIIDRFNADLQPLNSFVLPGGSKPAAWCHLARTVCRRAERAVVTLTRTESINPNIVIYLNRLSDLLFVLARVQNEKGKADILWKPGGKIRSEESGSEE